MGALFPHNLRSHLPSTRCHNREDGSMISCVCLTLVIPMCFWSYKCESFSLTHHFIVKIYTYYQGYMFQLQGAILRLLYKNRSLCGFWWTIGIPIVFQKPDKDPFLYRALMMAPCSWNMLPRWYLCISTIKWCVRLNDSRIYKISLCLQIFWSCCATVHYNRNDEWYRTLFGLWALVCSCVPWEQWGMDRQMFGMSCSVLHIHYRDSSLR
jgi:hypothetical protein